MQTLKKLYWTALENYKDRQRRDQFIKSHIGSKCSCNVCGWSGSDWYEKAMGQSIIPRVCPRCDSKSRQRLLKLMLEQADFINSNARLIHVSPHHGERWISKWMGLKRVDYLSIDISPGVAMKVMDLTAMDFQDGVIDIIVCCHVLEHIENDLQAIQEIYRVLRNNGVALLQVPIYGDVTEKVDTPTQADSFHIWHPGHDYYKRYEQVGFKVSSFGVDKLDNFLVDKLALSSNDIIHICTKC